MLHVGLSSTLQSAADGATSIEIEATTIRELLTRLAERYPDMNEHLKVGIAVSIDGEIYRDNWREEIPTNAEVYLLPRIPGG